MADQKIRISWDEVHSPQVDARLKQQEHLARAGQHVQRTTSPADSVGTFRAPDTQVGQTASLYYNPAFYMSVFGCLGALPGALAMNFVFWNEAISTPPARQIYLSMILYGMLVAVFLGVAEAVMSRNSREFLKCFGIGTLVGFVAGLFYPIASGLLMEFVAKLGRLEEARTLGEALPLEIAARATAWAVMGLFVGSVPGIALRSLRKTGLGMAGGLIGGLIGGSIFIPLNLLFDSAGFSRLAGCCLVGTLIGAAMGLLENVAKTGWLQVATGLIAGKQFILYRNPTVIGSSPQCEIYLFKDPQIAPAHAAIRLLPGGFELEDLHSATGTFINGQIVQRQRLKHNDQVQIGATRLVFQEKRRTSTPTS